MDVARTVGVLLAVALCAGCGHGPVLPTATGSATTAVRPSTTAAGGPSSALPGGGSDVSLAPVVDGGLPVSSTSTRAQDAVYAISQAVPDSAYGGVVPGGGNGIVVSVLPGSPDPTLKRLIDQAVREGVIVQVRTGSATLAQLEALGDHGIYDRLPVGLRDHLHVTQVDVENNRVVATFDVPLDDALRATVARTFGDDVAVAYGRVSIGM